MEGLAIGVLLRLGLRLRLGLGLGLSISSDFFFLLLLLLHNLLFFHRSFQPCVGYFLRHGHRCLRHLNLDLDVRRHAVLRLGLCQRWRRGQGPRTHLSPVDHLVPAVVFLDVFGNLALGRPTQNLLLRIRVVNELLDLRDRLGVRARVDDVLGSINRR